MFELLLWRHIEKGQPVNDECRIYFFTNFIYPENISTNFCMYILIKTDWIWDGNPRNLLNLHFGSKTIVFYWKYIINNSISIENKNIHKFIIIIFMNKKQWIYCTHLNHVRCIKFIFYCHHLSSGHGHTVIEWHSVVHVRFSGITIK